jgi:hypothetical protein
VNEAMQKDIAYAASRQPALPKTFKTMNLLGVVERLARGVAHYSAWGTLSTQQLRGGANWDLRSIQAATENITIAPGSVFITNQSGDSRYPAMMVALCAAVNGEGGVAYTDQLTISANGTTQIRTFNDSALARGCYEGMMLILEMYKKCNAGPEVALACTRGMHMVKTVVGHNDEGGFVRNVSSRGVFNSSWSNLDA